jgi:CBS domain-containing membrane protein
VTELLVQNLMTLGVKTLGPEGNLAEASDLMVLHRIRHVPIVDGDSKILGLVSQRDLLRGALGGGTELPSSIQHAYLRSIGVTEVMVETVEIVTPDTPIRDAARRMLDGKIGSQLVVEDGRLVGILTEHDFVRYVHSTLV